MSPPASRRRLRGPWTLDEHQRPALAGEILKAVES